MLCCGCSRQLWLQPAHGPRGAVPGGPGLRPDAPAGAREARRRGLRPGHQARRPSAVVEAAPVLQPQDVGLLCADGGECSPPRGPCLRVAPGTRATAASESLTGVTCSLARVLSILSLVAALCPGWVGTVWGPRCPSARSPVGPGWPARPPPPGGSAEMGRRGSALRTGLWQGEQRNGVLRQEARAMGQ